MFFSWSTLVTSPHSKFGRLNIKMFQVEGMKHQGLSIGLSYSMNLLVPGDSK